MLEDLYPYMDDRIVDKLDRPLGHYQFEAIDWLPTWGNEGGGVGVDSNGAAKDGEDILEMMKEWGQTCRCNTRYGKHPSSELSADERGGLPGL